MTIRIELSLKEYSNIIGTLEVLKNEFSDNSLFWRNKVLDIIDKLEDNRKTIK